MISRSIGGGDNGLRSCSVSREVTEQETPYSLYPQTRMLWLVEDAVPLPAHMTYLSALILPPREDKKTDQSPDESSRSSSPSASLSALLSDPLSRVLSSSPLSDSLEDVCEGIRRGRERLTEVSDGDCSRRLFELLGPEDASSALRRYCGGDIDT